MLHVDKSAPKITYFNLLAKLCQSWWIFGNAFVGVRLDLIGREDVTVEQKLSHEFLAIVDPQVRVVVVRTGVISGAVHDVLRVIHQLRTHLRQLLHLFHVSLQFQQVITD